MYRVSRELGVSSASQCDPEAISHCSEIMLVFSYFLQLSFCFFFLASRVRRHAAECYVSARKFNLDPSGMRRLRPSESERKMMLITTTTDIITHTFMHICVHTNIAKVSIVSSMQYNA